MKTVKLITNTQTFFNDLADVIRLMLAPCEVKQDEGEIVIRHEQIIAGSVIKDKCVYENAPNINGALISLCRFEGTDLIRETESALELGGVLAQKRSQKRSSKTCLFELLGGVKEQLPPWGSLTGIRPTRLFYEALENGLSESETQDYMNRNFYVKREKVQLLNDIIDMQRGIRNRNGNEFDLYIGIPFCTTRCSYCSFAAGELGKGKLVQPYVDALLRELRETADIIAENGGHVRAAYIGGGTPTAISAEQLRLIIEATQKYYPDAVEWTVEAGRPDTITREKLQMLRDMNIGRICVNPQTFHDETLRCIGRAHTSEQTVEAYLLAREMGFEHINMDFIAALPGESEKMFAQSIRKAIDLAPESITVHALALKHSSRLNEQKYQQTSEDIAENMVSFARETLQAAGYNPYYLYRQKYMAGNLENVGYAREGCACLYNIGNMEETMPVLAFGAGAITKWLFPGRNDGGRDERIERAPNVRNIEEYISRVDEMVNRKHALILQ